MKSLFNSTMNTRAIFPNSLKYIRSDVPNRITAEEMQWLIENNITTIIDLREENERVQKNCPLIENSNVNYLCMPVTGGNAIPENADSVSKSYIRMADSNMRRII